MDTDTLTTCLWFDGQAEEAARFYCGLLPRSEITEVLHAPTDYPAGRTGDVLDVSFTLMGRPFLALNGGAYTQFTEAVSLMIRAGRRRRWTVTGRRCRPGRKPRPAAG